MAIQYKTKLGFEIIELTEEKTNSKAVICPERGGILLELILNGEEILYLNEETFANPKQNIRGGNPILFPISGALTNHTYQIDDTTYSLKQHGFARNKPWFVEDQGENYITLCLEDDDETLAVYPFEFTLLFTYILEDGKIKIHQQYENHSNKTMPFYAGFHPYFIGNHRNCQYEIPTKKFFDTTILKPEVLSTEIQQLAIEPSKAFYELAEQKAVVHIEEKKIVLTFSEEFKVLVLWSAAPECYLCLEPWMAEPDAFNRDAQLMQLKAGQVCVAWFTIAN